MDSTIIAAIIGAVAIIVAATISILRREPKQKQTAGVSDPIQKPEPNKLEKDTSVVIHRCEANLIVGRNVDASAKRLGDIAIERSDKNAILALWRAICDTRNLPAIIDPCAYTIGRIVWETLDPTIENLGFDIFNQSIGTRSELIVDKFAYATGEVVLHSGKEKTRQRAKRFINKNASSSNRIVRDKYSFTKNRVNSSIAHGRG